MMSKLWILLIAFFGAGCAGKVAEEKRMPPTDDEIRRFVVNEEMHPAQERLLVMDTLLLNSGEDSAAFRRTTGMLQQALSHPNSPFRNEALYIRLMQAQLKSPWYMEAEKTAIESKLNLAMQNRVGQTANDFVFLTAGGKEKSLYDVAANYLLLYFYNPECQACKEVKEQLIHSTIIQSQLKSGTLRILAIYPDKDASIWREHLPEMPENWVHGRDVDEYIFKNGVYDLKAIPTMYLLDKEKKVLLKDAVEVGEVERGVSGF